MALTQLASQTWTLTKKDLLLIAQRRWFSTFIRAVAFPIVLTVILASVKNWIHNNGGYGFGNPSPIRSLSEAFDYVGSTRSKFVIVDRDLAGDDVRSVIDELSKMARNGNRELHTLQDSSEIANICPSSSKGVTDCFGAVDFWSSPETTPGGIWNYTVWQDSVIRGADVRRDDNAVQVYTLPLQHALDIMISRRSNGTVVPDTILQYPFTEQTQAEEDFKDSKFFGLLVTQAIAFALFLGLCGIAYHLTGHVVRQREEGMLQLIDAQMPNKSRWESLIARMLATHIAFDVIYMPAWIVCGVVVGEIIYPASNTGWFVLLYFLAGLAMTSFSILASSLFRRQQLSAISAIVAAIAFAIVAQFSQSGQSSTNNAAVIATGLLFPPSSFVYFLVTSAVSEIFSQPINLSSSPLSLIGSLLDIRIYTITPGTFLGFFAFQILLYPILATIVERFMWGSSFRGRHFRSTAEMNGNALRVNKFTKRYKNAAKKRDRTLAVDQLSLDVFAGTIMCLLGANGSGKSTTLNSIAGLESITHGTIEIDGSGGIGMCPQKNVMWPNMSVEEHVDFFVQLKNPSLLRKERAQEVKLLISGCDLEHKTHAHSKTLSGGQQRKLQLAMMLAGGSRVCCVDEASSGIDPLARRKIWDILLRERGQRTILLTTHFLDESEVLADHIALLSKGKLRAEGTVASLKSSLGGGFQVFVPSHHNHYLEGLTTSNIVHHQASTDDIFDVTDSEALAGLLTKLEQRKVFDYRIEGPSIEKIFLRLADEMQLEGITTPSRSSSESKDLQPAPKHGAFVEDSSVTSSSMDLHTGRSPGPVRQTMVLFRKRLTILKHNFMPYIAALFVPLVVAGLVTRFLLNVSYEGLQCQDPSTQALYDSIPISITPSDLAFNSVLGPPNRVNPQLIQRLIPSQVFCYPGSTYCLTSGDYTPTYNILNVTSATDFNNQIRNSSQPNTYLPGGFWLGDGTTSDPPLLAWLADGYSGDNPFSLLGALDIVLQNTTMAISYNNFAQGYAPKDFFQSLVAVFTTLGFVLFPGLFALYPTRERLQKVRAMHYSNGISSGPLWIAYALFDFCFLLLIAVLVTAIWAANGYNWYGLGYMFVVFLFYGCAATAYSYVISLFAPSELAAIAMTCIVQVVIAMLFFVGCFLTVDMADLEVLYTQLDTIYYTMALVCPPVSLLRALLVTLNVYAISCDGAFLASNPGYIGLFGGPILYLILQFVLMVAFLVFWESGRSLEAFGIRFGSKKHRDSSDLEKEAVTASDAAEDAHRLSSNNLGLRVGHISKTFGTNKAVDDVSFGILPSEKFALLGPNGAGKSTMISLIRGDLRPDSLNQPEIHISGDSLMRTPVAAKQHLGVCPQFDAVDSMTLAEHLHFYARARGLNKKERNENVAEIIKRLGMQDHSNKLVKKLSGGTKRKLSLGIALISNPSVLLLDEPSSGMDAASKRALWKTLEAVSAGRSLLLTTHSMEEANSLCDRAGIMASRMLALGTISSLHERFGDKVYVHLVHQDAPRSSPRQMDELLQWANDTFAIAEAEKAVGGQLRFAVPVSQEGNGGDLPDGSSLGRMFRAIEAEKERMGIRDYSIGHATLDQVFLNVVGRHGVDEENSHVVQKKSIVQKILRR
ncbi:hypothetical protein AC579_7646 [Pseudocercospora musae]|uniref:ABC transporter domain-containing protein n=1 Tax=Pseudocercospora musae TaxID=113226 RepID=A0A139I4F9_9PEZI|nr:hypothetical protein AC579_7646 [Pseudocercospora musae]